MHKYVLLPASSAITGAEGRRVEVEEEEAAGRREEVGRAAASKEEEEAAGRAAEPIRASRPRMIAL